MSPALDASNVPPRARTRLGRAAWSVVGVAGVGTAFSLAAREFWPAEIACHLRPELGVLLGGVALAAFGLRLLRPALALLALAGFAAWPTLRLHLPIAPPAESAAPLRVAAANLLWSRDTIDGLLRWVDAERPDVLFLMELRPKDRLRFDELTQRGYAHRLLLPPNEEWHERTWGWALFSRRPLREPKASLSDRTLDAWIEHEGRPLRLLAAHALRPGQTVMTGIRNRTLAELGSLAGEQENVVVLGDLNVSECSPVFGDLLDAGGLRDTRQGFGRLGTWRVTVPRVRWKLHWLRLPIDHVLIGNELATLDRRVGDEIGSDHFPVVADVAWR